jgi:hypothetical protein
VTRRVGDALKYSLLDEWRVIIGLDNEKDDEHNSFIVEGDNEDVLECGWWLLERGVLWK